MKESLRANKELIPRRKLDAVMLPALEAHTLPPKAYWSEEILDLELEHVFFKEWVCTGRVEDIPKPGDYYARTLATEPIVVVRDAEGEIRAHLNVCRHRGCEIVHGSGHVKSFRCPYHGWLYSLNGDLRGTPDFQETLNFDKKDYGLRALRVEVWNNFIMVNLDPDATPYSQRMSEISDWGLDKYDLASFVTIDRFERPVECNWKVYVENGAEAYHVPWVHPGLQDMAPMKGWGELPRVDRATLDAHGGPISRPFMGAVGRGPLPDYAGCRRGGSSIQRLSDPHGLPEPYPADIG